MPITGYSSDFWIKPYGWGIKGTARRAPTVFSRPTYNSNPGRLPTIFMVSRLTVMTLWKSSKG